MALPPDLLPLNWTPYDPAWLVELAREQLPDEPEIVKALSNCTRAAAESPAMTYFVDPRRANQPGADWQFKRNVVLDDGHGDPLVLDVLKDGRIGGVEFLKYVLKKNP